MVQILERVRYFPGKLMSVEDFQNEQSYLLNRLRRLNRHVQGWGIVDGLGVSVSDANEVVISPGLAIDCAGNEIAVAEPVRLPICIGEGRLYVAICYREMGVGAIPAAGGFEFSRIREGAEVTLALADPGIGHRSIGPGTPGCGQAHPLCLARLERLRQRWQVRKVRHGG